MCFPSYLLFKSLTKFILIQFLVVDIIMWKILENFPKTGHWSVEARGYVKNSLDKNYLIKHHPFDTGKGLSNE